MSEWKVTASHRSRAAVIYVRQSTMLQVERNRESTARQNGQLGLPGPRAGLAARRGDGDR